MSAAPAIAKEDPATVTRLAPLPRLSLAALKRPEHVFRTFFVHLPSGWEQDDCRTAANLKPIAGSVARHDRIVFLAYDESWELHGIVEKSSPLSGVECTWSRVQSRQPVALSGTALEGGYRATFRGPNGWSILRASDNQVMIEGHASESAVLMAWSKHAPRKA